MKDKNNVLQKYDKLPTASIYFKSSKVEIKEGYVELFIESANFSARGLAKISTRNKINQIQERNVQINTCDKISEYTFP